MVAGIYRRLLTAALVVMGAAPATAQTTGEPIRYTLSFPAPHTHYVEVSAVVPTDRRPQVELMMAVWTPGSYLVREFERHVEAVSATSPDGRSLSVDKPAKNRWRVASGGAPAVTLRYRVYARELTMRTNWVDSEFAMLNGAPTFITLADGTPRPHEVIIAPPPGWSRSMTGLPDMGGAHRYRAPDFDTLVDSPIVVGNPLVHEFAVDGKRHYLVNIGDAGIFDGARAARDFERIVVEHRRFWGGLPYDKYVLLNVLSDTSVGGLEHRNSALLVLNRWSSRTPGAYRQWLEFVGHEHFHAWNVKRLRPVEIDPFDYEKEVYSESLWIAEGITEYYSLLTLHRAGLSTREELLDGLSNEIESLQTTPGRLQQSAAGASRDAWIKFYRPDENSPNVSVSYYTKGVVLGLLLDAKIRAATRGSRSLDDVMRAAYQRFSGPKGYTPQEFRQVAEQVAGVGLNTFWDTAVDGTAELDYAELLDTFGLRFRGSGSQSGKAWLGMTTRNDGGRLLVSQVRRGTPAYDAGLNVDDEILAIDDFRVRADRFDSRLDQYRSGDAVVLLVARREVLMRLNVTFGVEPARAWRLEPNLGANDVQQQRRNQWLRPN